MRKQWDEWAWDAWCIASGIGIWPRFIEPRLLNITFVNLSIPHILEELEGLKILHFSDLHWNEQFPSSFQKKLIEKINSLQPDLILFTGDFLSRSKLEDHEGLKRLLKSLKARIGCFAVLGNHDYDQYVSVNEKGDYDVQEPSPSSNVAKGFKRLFHSVPLTKQVTPKARGVKRHQQLISLLEQTPFQILNNTTKRVVYKGKAINITGLEEYTLGRFDPDAAFKEYDGRYPGIVLSHNPDTLERLKHYPGDLILSGHTHGGQVNLPFLWKRFIRLEHSQYKCGLKKLGKKLAYINRGLSGVMKFRWFAIPELTCITLRLCRNRDSSDFGDLFSHLSKPTPTQNGTQDVMGGGEF